MRLVAKVRGVCVYSDKLIDKVVGDKVYFTDGSWCSVEGSGFHIIGPGYVHVGRITSQDELITWGPYGFEVSRLIIQDIVADIDITVHQKPEIEFTVEGSERGILGIEHEVLNDTIILKGKKSILPETTEIPRIKIAVKIPLCPSISLANIAGKVNIADFGGTLQAKLQDGQINAGGAKNADLEIIGNGVISLHKINDGNLTTKVSGKGEIYVAKGLAYSFTATVSKDATGGIYMRGVANTANLGMFGGGEIILAECKYEFKQSVTGTGKIFIRNKAD